MSDGIFFSQKHGGWFFTNEVQSEAYGPFLTKEEARIGSDNYIKYIIEGQKAPDSEEEQTKIGHSFEIATLSEDKLEYNKQLLKLRYLDSKGLKCPYCSGDTLTIDVTDHLDDGIYVTVICETCNRSLREQYLLADVEFDD